jgi:hypothetical protein
MRRHFQVVQRPAEVGQVFGQRVIKRGVADVPSDIRQTRREPREHGFDQLRTG